MLTLAGLLAGFSGLADTPSQGDRLRVVTQNGYLPGIPVLVRMEVLGPNGAVDRELWDADATLSADQPEVILSTNRAVLRNGLGSALVIFTGGTNFNLNVTVGGLSTNRPLASLSTAAVTSVSGALPAGTTTWAGVVRVTGDLTVPAGSTLNILSNTLVLIDGVASGTTAPDLFVGGTLQSLGTESYPVTFTCSDAALRWGQIRHTNSSGSLYRYTSITRAGRAAGEGHTGTAPVIRPSGSTLVFENCNITDHAGMDRAQGDYGTPGKAMYSVNSDLTFRDCLLSRCRMGPEIEGTAVLMTNCWLLDLRGPDDSDGFYIHAQSTGQTCAFKHCVAAGGDDDGFDTLDSVIQVEDCIIRDWNNLLEDAKGISVFNGATHVRRSLIVNSTVGVAVKWSGGAPTLVTLNNTTVGGGCLTNVMAAWKANAPGPFIDIRITNCVLWGGNAVHSDFGDTNLTIVYSDLSEPWAGTGNLESDPLFGSEANHDFHLRPGSLCIDSGDPVSPLDPDGSRADMGAYPFDPARYASFQVALASPVNGAVFVSPADITLVADASSATSTVAQVEFFRGVTSLGSDPTSPFSVVWPAVPPGSYTLTAVATDNVGLAVTSAPVQITVQAAMSPWGGLELNGTSQYVTFGTAPGLGASNFTLETWFYWKGFGQTANSGTGGATAIPLIAKGRGEGDNSNLDCNYFFGVQTDGRLAADFEEYPTVGIGGTNQPITGVTPATSNAWHHAALTYDGTNWSLYLDGQLDNQRAVGKPPRWDSIQQASLGSALTSAGAPQGYFAGVLDEARIWNYARSAAQIASNLNHTIVSAPGLVGRWALDETNGIIAYDTSGSGNHGTNVNGPVWTWGYPFAAPPSVALTSPTNGQAFPVGANLTITCAASDSDGSVVKIRFYHDGLSLGEVTTAPYSLVWSNVPAGYYSLLAVAVDNGGLSATSAPVAILVGSGTGLTTNTLVAAGSVWKYLDNGSDQGTSWSSLAFNDSGWSNGLAPLGYCVGSASCAYTYATVVNCGPDIDNKYITTYFRHVFSLGDASRIAELLLRLLRDDGAVVYLNGAEVLRTNMPAGTLTYADYASTANNYPFDEVTLPASALTNLVVGNNVLAMEIHQGGAASSDIVMEAELRAVFVPPANYPPVVSLLSPFDGLTLAAPADLSLAANAYDPDGAVTNVEFRANSSPVGSVVADPYALNWPGVGAGVYALTAVAFDNTGQMATSAVVTVTVSTNTAAPVVWGKAPAAGTVTNLTQITVTFSKPVAGVNASDLLVNGGPAAALTGSGSNYTFFFVQPAYGTVSITWAASHGITDVFTPPHPFDAGGLGATWQYQLQDAVPPVVTGISPTPGATVPALRSVSVDFSENMVGLNAGDLLLNNAPATSVSGSGAGPYLFTFAQPANGPVLMSWAAGHGLQDAAGNAFTGSSWTYLLDTNVAGILISEIMYHPLSENPAEEYIELFNSGATSVNLAGWRLSSGVQFTFPNVAIGPGGFLVVAANVQVFTNKYPGVANVVGGWQGVLSNSRNDLDLDDALGRRADSVRYADEGDWAIRQRSPVDLGFQGWEWLKEHDGGGKSLELINPAMPNQYGQNWAASVVTNGTPGRANSVATNNIPPLVLDVQHRPLIPSDTDPVIVSARVLDEHKQNITVTLRWRVDAATPPAFASTNMFDDGTHGDGVAGDGLFAATLPPQVQSAVVEFYVRAEDQEGLVRTWPAAALNPNGVPLGQVANALYQVDTNLYTGGQPIYRLVMTEGERAVLYQIQHGTFGMYPGSPGTAQSDAAMNGTFISLDGTGGECRYLATFRNRGHGTRTAHPNNFRVDFPSDNPWKQVGTLNLNGQYTYMQIFGAALAQRSGLAGADSRAVQVRVNSTNLALLDNYPGRTYGSYAANEMLNGDWAGHHFSTDGGGNVYRAIRDIYVPSANFEYRGTNKTAYTNCFFKNSNTSEDDWSDLAAMLRVMGTNDLFTTENARQVINVEQWMLHLAIMTLFGNNETGLNSGYNDDYFMYRGVNDPRFILVYYDLDTILGRGSLATNATIWGCTTTHLSPPQDSGTAMSRLVHAPDFEPIYYRTLQRLLDTTFSAAQFNSLLNEVLGSFVPGTVFQTTTNWMNGRRAYVQSVIAPYVTPPSNAPLAVISGEPRPFTPLTGATLTVGGADIAAYRFSLNGAAFGDETPVALPIQLQALPHGSTNTVYVIGRTPAGVWQSEAAPSVSHTWVVLTNWPAVRLNEVLARNVAAVNHYGTYPDLIELYNEGPATADLSGLRLTDDLTAPTRFTFPAGTTLASGAYLVVCAGNSDDTPGLHTGFALSQEGEGVYLLDRATNGGSGAGFRGVRPAGGRPFHRPARRGRVGAHPADLRLRQRHPGAGRADGAQDQ